jgi:hypothetical protein
MKKRKLTESLKKLRSEERYDVIYGPRRQQIEKTLGGRILTIPIDQLEQMSSTENFFLVTDRYKGNSYLAVLQTKK